ncbi:hypothetical protein FNV43_RR10666 [Rhamnella rubrinervis]|uniref:Uncharacterized protein n=1 Tax=Rhamnella rubrinervis TaxID=2594499 RepID=A0A8K0MH41_9ROSA|nr:hypothetical protein FNV43_RR10666 [Rhamnella rubrinervis]
MLTIEFSDDNKQQPSTKTQMLILLFAAMAVLLGFLYASVIFMSRSYGPESRAVEVHIESFSASNFNVTSSPLLAEWKVELDIGNRKDHLRIDVEEIQSLLYYKDHEISCAMALKPIKVLSNKQGIVELNFNREACGENQPFLDDDLLHQLVEERRRGKIRFSLRIQIEMTFELLRSSWSWQRRVEPTCPEVDVVFEVGNEHGRLASETQVPIPCTV